MGSSLGIGGGVAGGSQDTDTLVKYLGDIAGIATGAASDYKNSGALSDMILGGRGFGQSRRYRQYNPYDPDYGYMEQDKARYWNEKPGQAPPTVDMVATAPSGEPTVAGQKKAYAGEDALSKATAGGTGASSAAQAPTSPWGPAGPPKPPIPATEGGANPIGSTGSGTPGALGPGQWDHGGIEGDKDFWDSLYRQRGPASNDNWASHDDAPVPGQGLLGDIENYGAWNGIDEKLANDLDWQSSGDLMDLERRELDSWQKFGNQNNLEAQTEKAIGWQRGGELSDLEQQEKWGYDEYGNPTSLENEVGSSYRGLAGPGQYDATRGGTLEGMIRNPGLSSAERSAMLASQTIPIQSALEAQKLEGDARQAATGNSAGRWGASNAMALDAAGQAAQAGRNVQTAAADYMRKDRSEGLSGLGNLQGQIDTRKAQGAQGLSNLSGQQRQAGALSLSGLSNLAGKQRANQQFGIQAGMGLNEQQRAAQAQAAQGVGGLGQRQRANTQWGLGALSDFNKGKSDQELTRLGLTKDLYDTTLQQGNLAADRAGQLASLVKGGSSNTDSSSMNAGFSV